jgi:hypothetical protein
LGSARCLYRRLSPERNAVGEHSNFETAQNRALFAGTVVVGGGGYEEANSVNISGGSCIDGYVNVTETVTIAGEVRRSG